MHNIRPIATDVTRSVVCVCVLTTRVSCAKTCEPIEMLFYGLSHVGPMNHVGLHDGGVKIGRIRSHSEG